MVQGVRRNMFWGQAGKRRGPSACVLVLLWQESCLGCLVFWSCVGGAPFCCWLCAIRLPSWFFQSAKVRRLLRAFVKELGLSMRFSFSIRSLWRSVCCLSTVDDTWHRRWQSNCIVNHSINFMIKRIGLRVHRSSQSNFSVHIYFGGIDDLFRLWEAGSAENINGGCRSFFRHRACCLFNLGSHSQIVDYTIQEKIRGCCLSL